MAPKLMKQECGNIPQADAVAQTAVPQSLLETRPENLGRRTATGGIVTAAAQGLRFSLYILSTAILARLLSPEDFGLVAMVGTLIALLRMLREGGLSTATVQRTNITEAQISNLFWLNVALGAAAAAVGALLSPAIAAFFREPRLTGVTIALSSSFLLSGASVQHLAILNRQMRFTALALIDISSMVIGLIVGVGMALGGLGYWSLVGMQLATPISELICAVCATRWKPSLFRQGNDMRSLIKFGASMSFSTLLRKIAGASDSIMIGRFFGADAVGIYSRGQALMIRPIDQLVFPFDIVMVPALARLQNDPDRFRRAFVSVYSLIAFVSFPMAGLFIALAGPIVLVVLGSGWESVAPIFAAFALAALHIPMGYASMWLLTTQGRSKDIVIAGLMFSIISVVSYAVGMPFGPLGVATSFSLFGIFVRLPVQYYIAGRSGHISARNLWSVFLGFLPSGLVVFAGAHIALLAVADFEALLQLSIGIIGGLTALGAYSVIVPFQRRSTREVFTTLTGLRRRSIG